MKHMKKQKIYLGKFDGFPEYWAIFTISEQYNFDVKNPLFTYHNHIMVNRQVTRKEAEMLLELVKHNGNGKVCGGPCSAIIELKA